VSDDFISGESLLREMAAEADKLGLPYSNNPDSLTEPVDAIDAMIEYASPEEGERAVQRPNPEMPELPHEPTDLDDQPEDPEEKEMAQDTLDYFLEYESHGRNKAAFERDFRAFLHCEDYSYGEKTIKHLIASVFPDEGKK
jgi:hypothetical protein